MPFNEVIDILSMLGVVVSANYTFILFQSIALEPGFASSSSKQLVFGTDKLVLCERTWLRRMQRSVLHQGEGIIRVIKWKNQLIAWANDLVIFLFTSFLDFYVC